METYILSLILVFLRCPAENSGCQNLNSDCPAMVAANPDHCTSTTLGTTCKLSCDNCHIEECGDYHGSCPSWAASGECSNNPGYMLVSCMKSCGVCYLETTTIPVTTKQQMTSSPTTMTSTASTTSQRTTTILQTTTLMMTTTTETTTPSSPTTTTAANTTPYPVTTTTIKSTMAANATNTQPKCDCTCVKDPLFIFNTSDTNTLEMQVRSAMETIKAELKVNSTSLSSSIRTRICASDDRQSSATIGWFGASLLVLVFGTIVLTDAVNFISYIVSRRT